MAKKKAEAEGDAKPEAQQKTRTPANPKSRADHLAPKPAVEAEK